MDELWPGLRLLVLIAAANSAPVLAKRVLGSRWAAPVDGGLRFVDGRPLLGASKTWRGIVVALLSTAVVAPFVGVPVAVGLTVGAAAMAGDAFSSFVKRRLGAAPSSRATGLDQIPEALFPALAVQGTLGLTAWHVIGVTLAFFLLEMPLSVLFHRLGLRDRPY